jgi:S-formylglutathione hydrolase FrmB
MSYVGVALLPCAQTLHNQWFDTRAKQRSNTCIPPSITAFNAYLGESKDSWSQYDATELAKSYDGPKLPPILIDQVKLMFCMPMG